MFVSSYSTYITSNTPDKISKVSHEKQRNQQEKFSSELASKSKAPLSFSNNLPINYISQNKALVNRQALNYQSDKKNSDEIKKTKELTTSLSKQNSLNSVKSAYIGNTKMFSFLVKPKATLSQTPQIDSRQPTEVQEIQEKNLRLVMVNTYLADDKYYKITA